MKHCFVILHFKKESLKETISCVNKILTFDRNILGKIVVVENGSNDGSYEHLKEVFTSEDVVIVPSKQNLGFANGNNLGELIY